MKRSLLILFALLFTVRGIFGQESPADVNVLPTVIPPTPEAFAIGKFGNNPIGLFSGTVSYSVPLYNLKLNGITIPISLSYSSNGLRVDEVASRVGMQWKMDFAGVINRTIIGNPDETDQESCRPSTHDTASWGFYDFLEIAGAGGVWEEAHPDMFNYSIPGYSGSFVLDKNWNIIQLPYNNLQITLYGEIDSFRIVTPDGNIFIFGPNGGDVAENTSLPGGGGGECISEFGSSAPQTAWYLSTIRLTNGQTINYEYEGVSATYLTGVNQTYSFKPLYLFNYLEFSYSEYPYKTCYQLTVYAGRVLKEIKFPGGKVKLFYSSRDDIDGEKKLDSLHIQNTDSLVVKKYKFGYQYSYNSSTAYDSKQYVWSGSTIQALYPELRKRLFLTSVNDYMGPDTLSYKFEYNDFNSLAPRLSYAQDYWGYYNGISGQDLNFFPAWTPGGMYLWGGFEFGADRRGHFESCQKGILKKITYPTGGYTDYTYEPADSFLSWKPIFDTLNFSNSVNPSNNLYTTSSFTLYPGVSKFSIVPSADPYEPPGENEPQEPEPDMNIYVTIKNSSNETIYSYIGSVWAPYFLPHMYIANQDTYTVTVQSTYPPEVDFTIRIFRFLPSSVQPLTPAGGLRVKSLYDNDGLGKVQNKRTFQYKLVATANLLPSLLNPNSEDLFYQAYRGTKVISDGQFYVYTLMQLFSSSQFPLYMNGMGNPQYTNVTEEFRDKSDNVTGGIEHKFLINGKTKPQYLGEQDIIYGWPANFTDSTYAKITVPGGPWTNTDLHNGAELETTVFKMSNPTTKLIASRTKNIYSIDSRWSFKDTLYSIRRTLTPMLNFNWIKYFIHYDVNKYFIYSNWMHLDTSITKTYTDTGDSLTIAQSFAYGNLAHMQPTLVKQKNSKGDSISTTNKYPHDFSGTSPYTDMISRNMITAVIEQSQKNITLNRELSKTKTNYQFWQGNSFIAPATVEQRVLNNSLQTKLRFSSYDNKRNVLTVSKENDIKLSYVWDYQQAYPIAQVTNADSASIAFTSFEADGKGNWSFSGSTTTHPSAPTGTKGYSLAGGNITKSGLTAGTTYNITYWKRDSSSTVTVNSGNGTVLVTKNGWKLYSHEISGTTSLTIAGTAYIDEMRLYPKGALMISYTYIPLIGTSTQCDANNRITYYEYDSFGRLKLIKDEDKKIIKRVDYRYQASYQQ
ncbi:MAG: hypothetical protein ACHQFX_00425 [Chitinophagales bacterium]